MNNVLSCFFPTTVVLVDDNENFLDSVKDILCHQNISLKSFSNAVEALNFINESSENNSLTFSDLTITGEEIVSDWKSVLININKLHNEIYSEDRFSKISTIIVDYSMPGLDGIELCSKIKNPNIQKVLLTGVADEKIAIDSFNNGYINRFIKKSSHILTEELKSSLEKSIYQYFSIYTADLTKYIPSQEKNHLRDPIFSNFFFNTCLSKDYVEYYMLDNFGSYLFLTETGDPNLLSVLTESEMARLLEIGIDSGEISQSVLSGMQSREYMPVFHSRTGLLPPINEWDHYLRPARRLDGYQTYYFSFADSGMLDIDAERIKSFHQFRSKNGD